MGQSFHMKGSGFDASLVKLSTAGLDEPAIFIFPIPKEIIEHIKGFHPDNNFVRYVRPPRDRIVCFSLENSWKSEIGVWGGVV